MRIFKNRLGTGPFYFLFAIAFSLFVFPLPTQSANKKQDPTVTSKQIEALPRSASPGKFSEARIALYQALLDLTNPWTVMCIAAHPDDEDGTSLIVMRRKYGAHTVSLFSTFGEGGQNAIGPELYEELGAIRARETMAAAEIQGSEPHFLGLKDFGYSKSADEAFKFWGHDEALRRMVLEIRRLRPDVIITNHSATNNDHGHHQATARLELEAFDAAADPKRFPEQLKDGVTIWQVQRLFVRAGRSNQAQADNRPVVTIDPNERDPIRNTVFAEEALRALQKHATQGPWPKTFAEFAARFRSFTGQSSAPGQLPLTRYVLVREANGADALTKESHNFLDGLRLPDEVSKQLAPPTIENRPLTDSVDQRARVLDALVAARQRQIFGKEISAGPNGVPTDQRRARMQVRLNVALANASGLSARLSALNGVLIPGESTSFELALTNNGDNSIRVGSIQSAMGTAKDYITLSANRNVDSDIPNGETIKIPLAYKTPTNALLTVPHSEHLYDKGFAGTPVVAAVFVELKGIKFSVIAQTRSDVAPPVEIADVAPSPAILTPATTDDGARKTSPTKRISFTLKLINHQLTAFDGNLIAANGITHERTDRVALRLTASESKTVTLMVQEPPDLGPHTPASFMLQSAKVNSPPLRVPVIYADAHVAPKLRVGYVRGFDYSLPNALTALGVESHELSVDEVKTTDLQKYTTIIVDNRVYESQPELIATNQRLLDFANAGGTLIVFYHKSNEWNPDPRRNRPQQLAPYKLILGDERITDETAPITFIEPDHPLLNSPNKIGPDDFKDWIQERGLYYPKEWDPQYHALLQSNDLGEAPLKGGLLVADYGRGHYIYTSMVWYRELRAGIPGAYRMLANMISYGQAEKKSKK